MRKVKVCPFLTSVLMSVVLILCSFVSLVHASEYPDPTNGNYSETERIYEGDGYKVTFSLVSSWDSGYNLGVEIENTGRETIQNWHLSFDYAGEITNIWCAEIQETTAEGYIVRNAGYNMDIAPGGKTSFGISENTPFPGFPENTVIPGADNETVSGEYSVVYAVENDWGDGFVGSICITNNTGSTINDWCLAFDFNREIISVWGGVIISSVNGHYVVRHAVDNPDILPGQSVTFGMIGSGGTSSDEPENYDLTSYNVGNVQIDDPEIDTDGDGLVDGIEETIGTDPELADTDGDGLSDYQEIYLTWTDPLLTDTDNNGITDAYEDLDEDGLGNLDEIIRGTDIGNPDTDRDDLSDYDEIYEYGTDPLNPDSDGDTLTDGDDVLLGFSPLLPDTDYNGILDCNEFVYQTAENSFPIGDGRGITNVSVSMNVSGNIEKEIGILNMYDFDVRSREVVGIIGVPIEIRTDQMFDSATITFSYDESMLGDASEDDLSLMWYDEENDWYQILDQECIIDTINNTVSYTTTHFSTYLLADVSKWYEFWNTTYNSYNPDDISIDPIYGNVDTDYVIISDYPYFISSDQQTLIDQLKENICQKISLENGLIIANITSQDGEGRNWNGDGKYLSAGREYYQNNGFVFRYDTDKYTIVSKPYDADMNTILESVIYAVDMYPERYDSDIISTIIISNGNISVSDSVLQECVNRGIRIYSVDVVNESANVNFKNLSDITGGKYYYGQIYDDIPAFTDLLLGDAKGIINTADQDADGIPDFYEEHGMICSNGKILFSDPARSHSDNDGLKDGLEVEMTADDVKYIGRGKNLTIHYFVEHSDPLKEDTDGDGLSDNIDPYPLQGKCVEYQIDNGYHNFVFLNIDGYEGGDQNWWMDKDTFNQLYKHRYLNYINNVNFRTREGGCGLVAMTDLELFLAQQNGYRSSSIQSIPSYDANGAFSQSDYMEYANNNRENTYHLQGATYDYFSGVTVDDVELGLSLYLYYNGATDVVVDWAPSYDKNALLEDVRLMIHRNCPVVFSYYTFIKDDRLIYYANMQDAIDNLEKPKDYLTATGHYATIVGYIKYFDGNKIKYLLKVASNGGLYYVNYDKYSEKISWFSNILEYSYR